MRRTGYRSATGQARHVLVLQDAEAARQVWPPAERLPTGSPHYRALSGSRAARPARRRAPASRCIAWFSIRRFDGIAASAQTIAW